MPSASLAEMEFSELLACFFGVSAPLEEAIRAAGSKSELPYKTVESYLVAGEVGRSLMLQVPGLNEELLAELDLLLTEAGYFCAPEVSVPVGHPKSELSTQVAEAPSVIEYEQGGDTLLAQSLDQFVTGQGVASTRLVNAIHEAVETGVCPFKNIGAYIRCRTRMEKLREIANVGRGTAIEFEGLVAGALQTKSLTSTHLNVNGYIDIGSMLKEIYSLLTTSQKEVIVGRFLKKQTLESVASVRGVSRERIRQIEEKSLRILSTKFQTTLRDSAQFVCSRLSDDEFFELSIEEFARLSSCEIDEAIVYLALLKKFGVDQSTLDAFEGNVFVRNHYVSRKDWKKTLTEELRSKPLPLVMDEVLESVRSVPMFYIRDYFKRRLGAKTNDAGDVVPTYGTSRMCIDVLRKAGGPLHTSDVRARIYAIFHIDIEEHAINAVLGRLRETLITAPGTYALYESLPYTPVQLASIRNRAHDYLAAKGAFLSSKILFDQAFASRLDDYPGPLNHYLVMGIVQDDERFVTKRGNMVGLVTFDPSETYTPLQDEIRKIVIDHGPITIQEISARLSATRRLCNDSGIRQVLSQSSEVIRIGRRTFDSLRRFFDTRQDYDDLLLAIRISLLEKKKTTYAITQDLSRIELKKLTSHLIESMLLSMDDVRTEGDIHELVGASTELSQYNDVAMRVLGEGGMAEDISASLGDKVPDGLLARLISLDARFRTDFNAQGDSTENAELASILRDFEL